MTQHQCGRSSSEMDRHKAWLYKLRDDQGRKRGEMVVSGAPSTKGETVGALTMHYGADRIEWVKPIGDPDVIPCEGHDCDEKKKTNNPLQHKHREGRNADTDRQPNEPANRGEQKPR